MCGILGCVVVDGDRSSVMETLFNIFHNQKTRGTQGAGISINNTGSKLFRFRSIEPYRLFAVHNQKVWDNLKQGSLVLFHHRYPTSSPNELKYNHPIASEDGKVHVIHNGILSNEHELFDELKDNHTFETKDKEGNRFTDTEVVVHVFEEVYKGKKENIIKALEHVYKKVKGSYALAYNIEGEDKIYLIKNSMPIIISKDEAGNHYFSSEHDKELNTEIVCELEAGEIGVLDKGGYKKIMIAEPSEEDVAKAKAIEVNRKKWKRSKNKHKWRFDDNFGFVDYDSVVGEERWW